MLHSSSTHEVSPEKHKINIFGQEKRNQHSIDMIFPNDLIHATPMMKFIQNVLNTSSHVGKVSACSNLHRSVTYTNNIKKPIFTKKTKGILLAGKGRFLLSFIYFFQIMFFP